VISALLFLVEDSAGLLAFDVAARRCLDMLGDALVYGFSLFVLARSARWQAVAAMTKGSFMLAFGIGARAATRFLIPRCLASKPLKRGLELAWVPTSRRDNLAISCFSTLRRYSREHPFIGVGDPSLHQRGSVSLRDRARARR
jgi:hypothetical protein